MSGQETLRAIGQCLTCAEDALVVRGEHTVAIGNLRCRIQTSYARYGRKTGSNDPPPRDFAIEIPSGKKALSVPSRMR